MNVDTRFLSHTLPQNASKVNPTAHQNDSSSQTTGFHPRDAKTVQHRQANECDSQAKRIKNRNHIISLDTKKVFNKIQHPFMIKTLNKLDIEGIHLEIMKAICISSFSHC